MKKATLATLKSFIRKNADNLHINQKSSFDGMVDCVMPTTGGMQKAVPDPSHVDRRLGYVGIWTVGGSRDYIEPYDQNGFTGFEVSNSCGTFIVAIPKA